MRHGRLPSSPFEVLHILIFMIGLLTVGLSAISALAWVVETLLAADIRAQIVTGAPWLLAGVCIGIGVSFVVSELDRQEVDGEP